MVVWEYGSMGVIQKRRGTWDSNKDAEARGIQTKTQRHVGFKQRRRGTWDSNKDAEARGIQTKMQRHVGFKQRCRGTWDSNKDAEARPFNTEAQRRRGTEGRIEHRTQNNNLFFWVLCSILPSAPLCLCVEWASP
jgi:hypothetical protein